MKENSQIFKKFLQDNRQVFYSIALMIIIPGLLILNTILLFNFFKEAIDVSLGDKAVRMGQAVNTALADKLDSPEQIQIFIDDWQKYVEDVKELDVFYKDEDSFRLIAGFEKEQIGRIDKMGNYALAWTTDLPYALKFSLKEENINRNYWQVVMPLNNLQDEKKALLSMRLSADEVDAKMASVLGWSYGLLIITIFFIIILLLGNSRLFEYSILYNKIKEVDMMKDEFVSMASHELRTPVTAIRGYVSLMLEESGRLNLNDESKEYLSIIDISTGRLSSLIEDLLDVSRIEQGRLKINTSETDVWPVIEETLKELKIQADQKGLSLTSLLEPETMTMLKIDKDRFKQILINIIGNSIKYTNSGGVEIKGKNKDNNFVLTIRDTGIGMTAKEREHLFEKFYRVKNKKTTDIIGTGLGLWITKQIVELMNGTISIDSMEGVGTQVTFEFPLLNNNK